MSTCVHAALVTRDKWQLLKCPLMDGWIHKMWSIPTLEYYSAVKRSEVLTPATVWMNLENMMLGERSHPKSSKFYDSINRKCPEEVNPQR